MDDLRIHLDEGEKKTTFVKVQDIEPILESNKEWRGVEQKNNWGRKIATIPNVVLVQWLHEEVDRGNTTLRMYTPEFDEVIRRKLADPDNFNLRTDKPALQAGWSAGLVT